MAMEKNSYSNLSYEVEDFDESWMDYDDSWVDEYVYYLEVLENRTPEENQKIAYHEAAHVLALYNLGIDIDYATIVPDESSDGHVKGSICESEYYNMKGAAILLAGFIAEYKKFGEACLNGQDLIDINDTVFLMTKDDGEDSLFRLQLFDFTIDIFESPGSWEAVEAVAQALLINKVMLSESLKKIIRNAKRKANRNKKGS